MFKKLNLLRLVFDCRMSNVSCRHPPHSHLSTAGAISLIRLPPALNSEGQYPDGLWADVDVDDRPYVGVVVAVDLVDSVKTPRTSLGS